MEEWDATMTCEGAKWVTVLPSGMLFYKRKKLKKCFSEDIFCRKQGLKSKGKEFEEIQGVAGDTEVKWDRRE